MKNLLLVTCLSLLATSCVSLDGKLVVSEKLNLKIKTGFLNLQRKNIDIEASDYLAHIKVLGTNNYNLELDRGSEKIIVPIKSKSNVNLPKTDGEFKISHNDIDQTYDLKGNLVTTFHTSLTQEDIEGCTWYTTERECNEVCNKDFKAPIQDHNSQHGGDQHGPSNGGHDNRGDQGGGCHRECSDISVPHNGNQDVIFHYTTTNRDLTFDFLKADTDESVGRFVGGDSHTEKIVEQASLCR